MDEIDIDGLWEAFKKAAAERATAEEKFECARKRLLPACAIATEKMRSGKTARSGVSSVF